MKTTKRDYQISIRMNEELYDKLEKEAEKEEKYIGQYVRQVLEKYLKGKYNEERK